MTAHSTLKTDAQMQQIMNRFSTVCRNFGLTISTKNTEVVHQPAPQKTYIEPTITAEREILKAVDMFTYLGSRLSRSVNIDDEKRRPIRLVARAVLGRSARARAELPESLRATRLKPVLLRMHTWSFDCLPSAVEQVQPV
ncbi:hypothetical protein NDU88_004815 [Pleurodeles waltl]|uniref:Uncharacterized protein n=1 Tax=Pleurodeles waltl TaxID=8319 RepID=A0AAV7SK05_PLEWA|nr:hypothetical protein NDU88_004815 [Pleurodeles waltl]